MGYLVSFFSFCHRKIHDEVEVRFGVRFAMACSSINKMDEEALKAAFEPQESVDWAI